MIKIITHIKEKLYNNEDKIIEILNEIGCTYIHKSKINEIRFGRDNDSSGNANKIYIDSLHYKSYSANETGDILTLVASMMNMSLGEAIKYLANYLGIKENYVRREVKKPFGNFWRDLTKINDENDDLPITYPDSKLNDYLKGGNLMWVKDNISLQTQEYFNVMLDIATGRYIIPWYNVANELVGVVGRYPMVEVPSKIPKYLSLIPMNKSKVLFGLNYNYKNILNENTMYIFESEKSTMLLHSYGLPLGVSIGSKNISNTQAKLIKSMFSNVIICFDHDVTESEIITEANKLVMKNPFTKIKVGYIIDKEHKYLKEGDKASPIDYGLETFCNLLSDCLVWLDE